MFTMKTEKAQAIEETATNMFGGLGCCSLKHIETLACSAWKGNCLMGKRIKIYTIINYMGNVVTSMFPNRMVEEQSLKLQ